MLLVFLWAVACDPPDVQEGLSCADGERCPAGQTCVDDMCRFDDTPEPDASIDSGVAFSCEFQTIAMGEDSVKSIDVTDPDSIYWSAEGSDRILRTARTSEDVATYIFHNDEADARPWGLGLDDTYVYWGQNRLSGKILRKPRGGGGVEELATGQNRVRYIALDQTDIFYATVDESEIGSLWRLPKGGGAPSEIAMGQNGPLHLAVDGQWLYWSNQGGSQVMKTTKDGSGPILQLKGGQEGVNGLAIDSGHVYWVNETEGVVVRVPKNGGERLVIASDQVGARGITVDESFVYWTNHAEGQVLRAPADGTGTVQVIAEGQVGAQAIAIDGGDLYWLNSLDSDNRLVHASMASCTVSASN